MPPPSKSTMKPMSSSMSEGGGAPLSNNLWIGNLSSDVSEADLIALFEKHGPVDSITNYSSRGYAFVYFKKIEDAKAAKEKIQGSIVHGNSIKIEFAKPAKPCKSLWVAGIGQSVSKDELEREFMKFGKIQEFKFLRDRSTAYVDYFRLEDASQALKNMNGKRIRDDQIRVDFLRSQPARREQGLDYRDGRDGQFPIRSVGTPDARWMAQESLNTYSELSHTGQKRHQFLPPGVRQEGQPSKVLWVSYPPTVPIDEDMLHNAMILFGEIERIKTFEDRNYAFVQFRSVDEARLAKEGLQGKLFNDPRISIEYSNSELAPNKEYLGNYPGIKGPGPDMQLNEVPLRQGQMDIFGHNRALLPLPGVHGPDMPLRPVGPQGSFEAGYPNSDLSDLASLHKPGGPNWRSSPAQGMISSPSGGLPPPKRSGAWDIFDASQLQREHKRSRVDGGLPPYDAPYPSKRIDDRGFPLDDRLSPADGRMSAGLGPRHPNPDYVWRGVIAKGGSPICRARCVPIEGIIPDIPDVVNCSARTGLDMLTKHYSDAIGFSIVYFLPDSESDFGSYTEFLRYLGAKNRAGVAKFDDGTTLFLVPPSDFLTRVLNVAGPERLYGVVLEFPQAGPGSAAVQPQYADVHLQTSQSGSNMMTQEESALQVDYSRGLHDRMKPSLKTLGPTSSSVQPINNAAVSQPPVALTPELIATLASLLPSNGKLLGPENPLMHSTTPTTGGGHVAPSPDKGLTQVWPQEHQMPEQSGHVMQQFSNHFHNQVQFVPQNQAYAPSSSIPSFPAQQAYSQMQERAFNLHQQGPVSSRPISSAVSSQVAVSSHVDQQHQLAVSHDPARLYGSSVYQATNPVSSMNDVNSGNIPQLHTLQLASGTDPSNQVQQLQTPLHGAGQETLETEEEKNRRYQTTLLFAANLLSKVQQPGNQAAHGPSSQ